MASQSKQETEAQRRGYPRKQRLQRERSSLPASTLTRAKAGLVLKQELSSMTHASEALSEAVCMASRAANCNMVSGDGACYVCACTEFSREVLVWLVVLTVAVSWQRSRNHH
jgi:recombinational DNA repair protein RecR